MSEGSSKNIFVEFHALVSHAPSNLNRDDLGAPKTVVFGGARRLRISSQCLKRSWRRSGLFRDAVQSDRLGERTSRLGEVVEKILEGDKKELAALERRGFDMLLASIGKKGKDDAAEDADDASVEVEEGADGDGDGSNEDRAARSETAHLLYLSTDEQRAVAVFVDQHRKELVAMAEEKANAKKVKDIRDRLKKHLVAYVPTSAVDVALFGRFLTNSEFREVDAAMQVAHALGTQKADVEYDYFTALDDRSNEAAADHIGETELGASVFYKYAVCDMGLLVENLGPSGEEIQYVEKNKKDKAAATKVEQHQANARRVAARALAGVAHAMARVVPTGKKNSTAPQNPADYLEVVVRRDAPVSLANAFLKPVRADGEADVLDVSIKQLRAHADIYDKMYGTDGVAARVVLSSRKLPDLPGSATKVESLKNLGDKVKKLLEGLQA